MRRVCVLLAAAALVAAGSSSLRADRSLQGPTPAARPTPASPVSTTLQKTVVSINERELVQKYCVTCHSDRAKTGGLTLESLDPENTAQHAEVWEKVVRKIRGGMMPPQGMPRPETATLEAFAATLEN